MNPKEFQEVGQRTADTVMDIINSSEGRCHASFRAVGACAGALSTLAVVIGHNPGDENLKTADFNPTKRITNDTILMAALLVAYSIDAIPEDAEVVGNGLAASHQRCAFGAGAVLSALNAFETLTGRKADDKLNPAMVAARP